MKPIGKVYHNVFQEVLTLYAVCNGEFLVWWRGSRRWLPASQMSIREVY